MTGTKYCKETLTQDGWYLANNKTDIEAMGFWAFHIDTLFFSVLVGWNFSILYLSDAARKLFTIQTRLNLQLFIEMMIDFINGVVTRNL